MKARVYLLLYLAGLLAAGLTLIWQHTPGYMDAEYYYAVGERWAAGEYSEPFVWNYLNQPQSLPAAAHTYWMPLTSLVAAAGIRLFGSTGYTAARALFLLFAGCIAPLAGCLAWRFSYSHKIAILAGIFSLFPGFYAQYVSITDTFVLCMLTGGLIFLSLSTLEEIQKGRWLLLFGIVSGALFGFMHLLRADGLVWLVGGVAWMVWMGIRKQWGWKLFLCLVGICVGYILVTFGWYVRNLDLFESLLPPGNSRGLWLTNYDEIVSLNPTLLTLARFAATGIGAILHDRLAALGTNLLTALAVQGNIVLLPFILLGGWALRKNNAVQFNLFLWILTLGVMSILFPYAGARGGFLHSGAAFQIVFWGLAVIGLDKAIHWASLKRNWDNRQAWGVFSAGVVLILILLTVSIYRTRVIGSSPETSGWDASWNQMERIEHALQTVGAQPRDVVVINDPPGLYAAAGRWGIVMPDGNPGESLKAAAQFGAKYLVLEENHVKGFDALYQNPESGIVPWLQYLGEVNSAYLYAITPERAP